MEHHELLQVIGMIPQQFSSNENKKLMLSSLFGTNFVILNIATQYYANTFQSNHFARVTLVDGTIKWRIMLNLCTSHCIGAPSVSQISYLYTWYITEHNTDTGFICKLCLSKFHRGLLPPACILNNLVIKSLPDVFGFQ